ncbi:MAG: DUF2142 domain-containing protein [Chloroflexi bacterium]|nr:DUF2142 domain-containing protein [Chloroflexota bacterium]
MLRRWATSRSRLGLLAAILLVGLIHGLLYVFLMPPWQHYDEPSHFEYVWLIANRPGLPKPGDYDQDMRRQVAASMLEHGFYGDLDSPPNLNDEAVYIGYAQLDDPPFYYLLASLPVRLLHGQSVTVQLYAARLVSLCLYLATILISWGMLGELVAAGHPLRWMVPITLALLPGFTDLMTAVNNDVGAVAAFSLFLWASVRLVRRGSSFFSLVFVFGAASLCYWMKNSVWLALPLLPVVLLFALLRGRWRLLAWALFLATVGIGLGAVFLWGDAALWYRRTLQTAPTRVVNSLAPLGEHALQLDLSLQKSNPAILQPLPPETVRDLRNAPVTFGAWIWSSQPMRAQMPGLSCDCGGQLQVFTREIQVGTEPRFYMLTATLPANARYVWVALTPPADMEEVQGTVFYDGLVLVKGERLAHDPPRFEDANGERGVWGEQPFANLLRNSSAEQAGPGVQSWANEIGTKILPAWPPSFPSDILVSLLDWKGAGWYYWESGTNMLRTFWAKFGWGHVPLAGSKPYRVLAVVTLLGMAGAGWATWRRRHALPWEVLLLLGLALLGIWVPAILRGIGSLFGWAFIPSARYAYSVIIPTLLVLNVGWLEILRLLGRWLRMAPKVQIAAYLLFFVALDALSILTITRFYYGR